MIYLASVCLICSYCNAEIERVTEREAQEALAWHQKYVQCMKEYQWASHVQQRYVQQRSYQIQTSRTPKMLQHQRLKSSRLQIYLEPNVNRLLLQQSWRTGFPCKHGGNSAPAYKQRSSSRIYQHQVQTLVVKVRQQGQKIQMIYSNEQEHCNVLQWIHITHADVCGSDDVLGRQILRLHGRRKIYVQNHVSNTSSNQQYVSGNI